MVASGGFRSEQRGVAIGMAFAGAVTVIVLFAAAWYGGSGPAVSLPDRLSAVVRADLLVVVWLALAIGNVARLRFISPEDIGGSSGDTESRHVRDARAVLQNTLEQAAFAIPVHLALAALLVDAVPLVVALVILFSIGRILFALGYSKGAAARSFGFALTFYPTLAALVIALAVTIMRL